MVRERAEGGKQKTGVRKMRRDAGRQEHEEMHDIRNLEDGVEAMKVRDEQEDEQSSPEEEVEEEATSPKSAKKNREKKIEIGATEEVPISGNAPTSQEDFSEMEEDLSPQAPGSDKKSKKEIEIDEKEAEKQREADMARLAEIKRKREEDRVKRLAKEAAEKEAAEKAEKEKAEKDAEKEKESEALKPIREALAKLIAVDVSKSLNQLNQEADAKKLLKPLLKKASVKQLNKATLTTIIGKDKRFKLSEENNIVHCKRVQE